MTPQQLGEQFLLSCIRDGLAHSYDTVTNTWVKPYPEVTGYLLSYFSHKNDLPNEIVDASQTLRALQHPTGGFSSFFNTDMLYTFDTAQITHGLSLLYKKTKNIDLLHAARRGGQFLLFMQQSDGSFFPTYNHKNKTKHVERIKPDGTNWGSTFSHIQVKNAEALLLLFQLTKDTRYLKSAQRLNAWAKTHADLRFSHPGAYYLEGLTALGETARVKSALKKRLTTIKNGFVPYAKSLPYAYVSGSMQLGILLAKTGRKRDAKKILDWGIRLQQHHPSGGLFQYADHDAHPNGSIHLELNSWGTKYFLELIDLLA